jgi:hypothetical protein
MQRPSYGSTRPYAMVKTLADLAVPGHGVVTLPLRMDWSQQHRYDLDLDSDRRLLYETVLNEALYPDDLGELLNAELLTRIWPQLWLPARVRGMWEEHFPELAARRAA